MAGQIIKRGERNYLVRVFLGRDPNTGKRRYLNKTVKGTRKDAEQSLTALQRAKDTDTLTLPVKMSLNSLLDKWLETAVKPRVSERTYTDRHEPGAACGLTQEAASGDGSHDGTGGGAFSGSG